MTKHCVFETFFVFVSHSRNTYSLRHWYIKVLWWFIKVFPIQGTVSQSQVDRVKSFLMKRDASLIAVLSGAEVEEASI